LRDWSLVSKTKAFPCHVLNWYGHSKKKANARASPKRYGIRGLKEFVPVIPREREKVILRTSQWLTSLITMPHFMDHLATATFHVNYHF